MDKIAKSITDSGNCNICVAFRIIDMEDFSKYSFLTYMGTPMSYWPGLCLLLGDFPLWRGWSVWLFTSMSELGILYVCDEVVEALAGGSYVARGEIKRLIQ